MPAEKSYDNITRERWECIREGAQTCGFQISGSTGQAQGFGVTLRWAFLPASQKLQIVILESTLLSPEKALEFIDGIVQDGE